MDLNPYSPPSLPESSEIPDAPPPHGWWIDGDRLLVMQGAQLPMVDPFNGRSLERMTLREFRIKHRPGWHRLTLLATIAAIVIGVALAMTDTLPLVAQLLWVVAPISLIFLLFASWRLDSVRIRAFCSDRTDGMIMISKGLSGVIVIGFVAALFSLALVRIALWIPYVAWAVFGLSFSAQLVIWFSHRKLICRLKRERRFEIRGLHPDAIEYLRKNHQAAAGIPVP
jgi:hypothetical protein